MNEEEIKTVFQRCGLIPKWMLTKTKLCKHKHGCYENVIMNMYTTFVKSLALKLLVSNYMYIFKVSKLFKNLKSWKSQRDNLRFALFWSLMSTVYRLILCLLRRILKTDKLAAPIAGFIAGLMSIIETPGRRKFYTILILSRFVDTAFRMVEYRKVVHIIPNFEVFLFIMGSISQCYAMWAENDIMNQGQLRFMIKWAQLKGRPMEMISTINRAVNDSLIR